MTSRWTNRWGRRNGVSLVLVLAAGLFVMSGQMCPITLPGIGLPMQGNSGLTGKYVGSERCSQCHANIHTNWLSTLHNKALDTLEAIGQGSNADCLGCHTVGFGEAGGFVSRSLTNVLAGVGCESCHGPGGNHASNVNDESLRPKPSISATICGKCHTGAHQPNFEDWSESAHAVVEPSVAVRFSNGTNLTSCGTCHSGDYRYHAIILGETVTNSLLQGVAPEEMNAITCAICHDPHAQTGNAQSPDEGRDFQLRYKQVVNTVASNTIADATNPARFNICGQCHHSREAVWTDSARPPHHSLQANVYVGEMPVPDGTAPLVASTTSAHALASEQCSTCHVYRRSFVSEMAPAISGHTFAVNFAGCVTTGCHPNEDNPNALLSTLQNGIQLRLNNIYTRLGNPKNWEFTSNGGPNAAGQNAIANPIKQIRFMYYYILNDGSLGAHNPDYVRDILTAAENLLTGQGL